MKKYILILFLFTTLLSGVYGQEIFDLNKSIRTALNNNLAISTYENNIEIQKLNIRTTYGDLIPTLNLSGTWSRNNTVSKGGTIFQNGVPIFIGDRNTTTDNFNLGLNTNVTLFNGFSNYENVTLAQQNLSSIYTNLERTKYDLVLNVTQKYFDVLKKDKVVQINQDNLKTSIDQLNRIKEYVNVGKKTISEVYKQDVQVGQNELAVTQSQNEFDKAKVELLNVMNDNINKEITVDERSIFVPTTLSEMTASMTKYSNSNSLFQNAINSRYDYRAARQDIEINRTRLDIANKNLFFPTISGFGSYNISGNQLNDITNNRVLTFGLSLNYSIFQGFKLDVNKQIAQVNIKQKEEDLIRLEQQIKTDLKKAILDMETAYKQIEILERNIRSAQQDVILSEENFRIGYGTLLDVQIAQTNLNNLLINRINNVYNFLLAQKQIEYLSGQLKY